MSTHPPTLSKPAVPASGTDHDALPAGTRFGEFEILRVLGVGGFGIVYLARDHSLEREVALKEYMPASLAARGAGAQITVRSSSFAETYAIGLRSFINEARLLARFDHPSLVKVYRFWEDNATAYMVMPFLQGVTLRDARRGMAHAPDEAWIRSVLNPILSALELLHREGVYHRDIAPDNILLPRDGPPVLLDFGAARRVISDRTQSLTAILKPSYAPIEQYAEMTQLRQGPWTDIYALGAVVHYLCFGVPPAPATARAVQDDGDAIESRIVPGVSPRFLEAMSWMLAIRPNQRPQSGDQLRAVLDGRAEVPPRGRHGSTVTGTLGSAETSQIEHAADATRINTAYLPTHLPTAPVGPPSASQPTNFSPTAPMPTAREARPSARSGPPSAAVPLATAAAAETQRHDEPRSQPASWAASRPPTLPPSSRPPATLPPLAKAAVAVPKAVPGARRGASKPWLVLAGGGLFVLVAALAAWQFSGRRAAASPAAASVEAPATPALSSTVPGTAIIIEAADPAPPAPLAKDARSTLSAPPVATGADAGLRTSTAERGAAFDTGAASAARLRPTGKPVPRVGDDPALASTAPAGAARALDPTSPQAPAVTGNSERSRGANPTTARDYPGAQRPATALPVVQNSIREVCGKHSFLARAVCMDERCEEPRFRSTPDCAEVLARKNRRGQP
ncbi:MAG: protein kinase [Caldimonas sp.]